MMSRHLLVRPKVDIRREPDVSVTPNFVNTQSSNPVVNADPKIEFSVDHSPVTAQPKPVSHSVTTPPTTPNRPEWSIMGGKDHFLIAGRITWDFRRASDEETDWGNKLLFLPAAKYMSMLVVESSPWNANDFDDPSRAYLKIEGWESWRESQQRGSLTFEKAGEVPAMGRR
ncbi:hypothetical protein RJ639_023238 [Escallonia herrerae]|uniref:Exostosin GT47 domain-containing protein n=1 Tax=Escallonia herrerae TaxID=1293975 RepID=A0AA88UZ34_9ASTE|nr:hypothetical protein RJ639_023238 [Escallonia herrerae]